MNGRGQFDHAEAGAEVTAGHRDGVDRLLAQFVGDLPDLLDLELAQILRGADRIEKRRFTEAGHGDIPIFMSGMWSEQYGYCAPIAHLEPDIIPSLLNGEACW
jgi:hypothetical protein